MIEDDFYATIKFKNGEEIFAKVAPSEEEEETFLIVSNPIVISEVKSRMGVVGYKLDPWLKTCDEDMLIVRMSEILTISESKSIEMIMMHQAFIRSNERNENNEPPISREMGYISNVNDAKTLLEKLYNSNSFQPPQR